MSSKAKKIENNVENTKKVQLYELYNTLCGSIIVTIGKLVNKTEDFMLEDFAKLAKDEELAKCKNIKEVCDYIIKRYEMPDCYKKYIVLVTDPDNLMTPIVTLGDDDFVYPLNKEGQYTGILTKDGFDMEYIYEENEDCIED